MYRCLVVLTVLLLWAGNAFALSGSGTEDNPWLIQSLEDFDEFAADSSYWDGHISLDVDIDLADRTYTTPVIAPDRDTDNTTYPFEGTPFTGVFDGNGHIISNLTIDTAGAGTDYLGLFGQIQRSGAKVEHLGLENINIIGGSHSWELGGLCGYNKEGTISNCYAIGSVNGGDYSYDLGGLCGFNSYGTISNCYSGVSVTGGGHSGALGVLCGVNGGIISNCYATGSVTGEKSSGDLGGLCGWNWASTIINCYATGSVTGGVDSRYLSGLCGMNSGSDISNSFWDVETSGIGVAGDDNFGAIGKTTLQMQTETTFTVGGWDFDPDDGDAADWMMLREGEDYPRLGWQEVFAGDIAGLYGVDAVDFAELALHWGQSGCPDGCEDADISGDGSVNASDLMYLVGDWPAGNWLH